MNKKPDTSSLIKLKPHEHIEEIIQKITPFAEQFIASRGDVLQYNIARKHQCYLLHSGSITLNRRGDGMVLNKENAPFILGVSNQYTTTSTLYVKVMENSLLSRLSVERFNLLTESYNLWQNLCFLLIYNAARVYEHSTIISQMSSYDVIRFQLNELISEPDEIRLNTTASTYILGRTYLSRSWVMRILSALKNEGHITLHRGILVKITALPDSLQV
ncbi:helix-turn-helix domain-containing protein [Salmonella enterica]|nr:cyclic nucleotide-binding protein [Salmonella enterica]EFS3370493.1 cyclic nucleotide-binding protein [Salmonella enterica]EGS4024463.1 cyclic nucleotide-binding protein [Salmonella enterica]EHT4473674.1 helix-turn-helix domain-containing protein [Salmonella enterica]EKM9605739.1 helix-turn-helix domain-containing protein [Salmonella enterica]